MRLLQRFGSGENNDANPNISVVRTESNTLAADRTGMRMLDRQSQRCGRLGLKGKTPESGR
jgi:hypothetical protein